MTTHSQFFQWWLKDIRPSVTDRLPSQKHQASVLDSTMDLESMECWDGTWDDCQVAEEGKACSLEVGRFSLVRKLEALEAGLVTRVRTTSITLESETNQINTENSDIEDGHLEELIIHGDDIFKMESVESVSTMLFFPLSTSMPTSDEGKTKLTQANVDSCSDYSLPTKPDSTEVQMDQDKRCSGASAIIKNVPSLPHAFILSNGILEQLEINKQKQKIQRGYKQTLWQGPLTSPSLIKEINQRRSLEEGDAVIRTSENNAKARKRHSSQPVAIPPAASSLHPFTNTLTTLLAADSFEGKDVGLSIAQIAKQMEDKTCGSLPVHPKPPRSRDVSKNFDENGVLYEATYPKILEDGTMEFLLPYDSDDEDTDSDDEDIELVDIRTNTVENESTREITSKVQSTEVEVEALIDRVALLNPEGKCRA